MASVSVWEDVDVNSFNLKYGTLKSVSLSRDSNSYGSLLMVSFQGDMIALGENKNGCLGLESDNTRESVKVQGLSLVSGVSVCDEFGDGLAYTREGKLYVWGANVHGNTCRKPVLMENLPKIIDARCIQGHYLALTDNGKVYEWRGTRTWENRLNTLSTTPTAVVLKDDIVGIACGAHHSLAVTKHGDVFSFGVKYDGRTYSKQGVTKISLPGETVAKVACGWGHSLALTQSGKVYTWGYNGCALGDDGGKIYESDTPLQVGGKIGRFVDIATNGWQTNAAVTDSGAVYMWGCNDKRDAVKTPILTQHTELLQVFSNISPSNCSWTYKDSYSVAHEDPALLGMEMAATFNVEDLSDMTLLVGNKAIYVHKYVLMLRSEFFRIWLQKRWTDKSKRQLRLTCYDYDVYLSYLWFLYSGEIKTSPQHILELWDLAVAYGEEKLKLGCENLISKNMTMKTLLHFKSRTSSRSLSEIESEKFTPLEEKINLIKEDYESQWQTLKSEYVNALKKLNNEYKATEGNDASQFARLSALLESEELETEQAAVARERALEVAKLKEGFIELEKHNLELETENIELKKLKNKLEEDNLKWEKAISIIKDFEENTKMSGTKVESGHKILQQTFKIPADNSTNLMAAYSEISKLEKKETKTENAESDQFETKEERKDGKGYRGETDQLMIKDVNIKTQASQSGIKEVDNKLEKDDTRTEEILINRERSYKELQEDYTQLEKLCRKLEKEKENREEECNRLQEKYKRLKEILLLLAFRD